MNLQKITDFYPWDDSTSKVGDGRDTLSGQFTLCLDRISGSGEFAFVYILLNLIKKGVLVKLVICNHSKIHYTSIFRKNVSAPPLLMLILLLLLAILSRLLRTWIYQSLNRTESWSWFSCLQKKLERSMVPAAGRN